MSAFLIKNEFYIFSEVGDFSSSGWSFFSFCLRNFFVFEGDVMKFECLPGLKTNPMGDVPFLIDPALFH